MHEIFTSAEILLPDFGKYPPYQWSVIACDQFTGDADYWKETAEIVGENPSTLHLILPEIYLTMPDVDQKIDDIHSHMREYLDKGIFQKYENAMIYTERMQSNGILRAGVIGKIDLEAYDYHKGSQSPVRATEATVLERIPPRMKVRTGAPLELPHIMILIDDPENMAIGTCTNAKGAMQKLYSTDLMQKGGSIAGFLMNPEQQKAFLDTLEIVTKKSGSIQFAMGDGNHSLATAKAYWEEFKKNHPNIKDHPARYALVELVNLHSDALQFEAIHRIVTETDTKALTKFLQDTLALSEMPSSQWVTIVNGTAQKKLYIHHTTSNLSVGSLQNALDEWLSGHAGKVDYIHGTETITKLSAQPDAIGFLLPDMDKQDLFPSVEKDGALPRKTFSMGHAEDKRYYMEARAIQ